MSPNADRGCLTGVRVCAISSVRSVAFLSPLTTCPPPQNSLRIGGGGGGYSDTGHCCIHVKLSLL